MAGVGCGSPCRDLFPLKQWPCGAWSGLQTPGSAAGQPAPVAQRPSPCPQVLSWAQQQGERLQAQTASLAAEREEMAQLIDWITAAEEALSLRDQEPLPEEAEQLEELNAQHTVRDPAPNSPPRQGPCCPPNPAWPRASARPDQGLSGAPG